MTLTTAVLTLTAVMAETVSMEALLTRWLVGSVNQDEMYSRGWCPPMSTSTPVATNQYSTSLGKRRPIEDFLSQSDTSAVTNPEDCKVHM